MGFTNRIEQALIKEATIRRKAITVSMELLPICNLNCKMCYIRTNMQEVNKNGGLLAVEQWLRLAQEMRDDGVLFLLLTGGEVFLYPRFKELYVSLYNMGFSITINTNGSLIDENTLEWLKQYPPKCVSISLYGASDEVYSKICNQKGVFERVNAAIRGLKENGIRIELKSILTPYNIDDAENCWQYAKDLDIFYQTSTYAFPPTRKANNEEIQRLEPREAVKARFESNRRISGDAEYKNRIIEYVQKYEDTKGKPGNTLYGFTCGATRNTSWITWQGKMTPCAMIENPYVLPFEMGFSAAWEQLKQLSDQILMSQKCAYCDKRFVCSVCPAMNYAETGRFDCASPFHCEMTNLYLERMNDFVKEWGMEDRIIRRGEKEP